MIDFQRKISNLDKAQSEEEMIKAVDDAISSGVDVQAMGGRAGK